MIRKSLLLIAALLTGGLQVMMGQSPYTGCEPANGEEYFLYNVETGLWIQGNTGKTTTNRDGWNTAANMGDYGRPFGFEANPNGEGWVIRTFGGGDDHHLGTSYGDASLLYLDWYNGDDYRYWTLTGTPDGYTITNGDYALAVEEGEAGVLRLVNHETENNHWQLVSREERLAELATATKDNPVNATWLLINPELMNNDRRQPQWTIARSGGDQGWGDSYRPNRIFESWNFGSLDFFQQVSAPNGRYQVRARALYSPTTIQGASYTDYLDYLANGESTVFATLYANEGEVKLPSIFSYTTAENTETTTGEYSTLVNPENEEEHICIIGWFDQAARAMSEDDRFYSDPVEGNVTDGLLRVGIHNLEGNPTSNWVIIGNFEVQYLGNDLDLSAYLEALQAALSDAEAFDGALTDALAGDLATAIAEGQAALSSTQSDLIGSVTAQLKAVLETAKNFDSNNLNLLKQIIEQAKLDGTDTAEAEDFVKNGRENGPLNDAIRNLRYARRRNAAERRTETFVGSVPTAGEFYIYNVGQKQFLTGGSDWGAHACLHYTGSPITLEPMAEGDENVNDMAFHLATQYFNGENRDYITYSGYLDGDKAGAWVFYPVEEKENVYYIFQNDYFPDVFWSYNPLARVDGGNSDETTVGTESRDLYICGEDAHWMLISREELEGFVNKATQDKPADATFYIQNPGFNQRLDVAAWQGLDQGFAIWERGANHYDFVAESWNVDEQVSLSQTTEANVPAGVYAITVQGFWRNGGHGEQGKRLRVGHVAGIRVPVRAVVNGGTCHRTKEANRWTGSHFLPKSE